MSYYRRSAVLTVGGFNEELNVMEHTDLLWKFEKAGYKVKFSKDVIHLHHRSIHRFTWRSRLGNAFTYGHDWHKLYHIHPDKTGISAMPVKTAAFVTLVLLSYFYPYALWVLFASLSFWFAFKFYRNRVRVRNCITHMERNIEKIGALMFVLASVISFETAEELGRLYSTLSSCKNKLGSPSQ